MRVAILDSGIDRSHEAFANLNIIQRNFTSEGIEDTTGHGTHCAAVIFGDTVEGTRTGVAPGVDTALVGKVLGSGGSSSAIVAKAIQWCLIEQAQVISMSLGIDFTTYVEQMMSRHGLNLRQATSIALDGYRQNIQMFDVLARFSEMAGPNGEGALLIAAAGNESARPRVSIAAGPPAASQKVLAVGAIGQAGNRFEVAPFSNSGVDLVAPGVDVVSAKLGGGLVSWSGTSMAAPHVTGLAALWGQRLIESGKPVTAALLNSQLVARATDRRLTMRGFSAIGYGLPEAPRS